MKQIARVSLVDTVVDRLRSEIVSGAWPVGSRIPTEAELVEALGVSRPSVREGVRALAQVGLLETRQGDGTYVIADNETAVALKHALHVADVREVLTVRRALDVVAAREAASRRTDDDLHRLQAALDGRRAAVAAEDVDAFIDHDVAFHIGIARASQNALLFELYRSFEDSLRDSVSRTNCFVNGTSDHDDFHSAILTAIESGDDTAATLAALSVLDDQEQSLNDVTP
jgi:DNA-binding FadR family transcriptional regulator